MASRERIDRWTLGLVVLAVVVRVAAVLVLGSHLVPRSTYEHGEIAANLVAGRGFSTRFLGADGPTSQQAPVYPYLVAGAYLMGGVETPVSLLLLQIGQAGLGGALVLAVVSLARQVSPGRPWSARLAGLVAALHPTLVYAATHVQVALLAATLVVGTLALAYRASSARSWRLAMATGFGLGLLVLTDPILGLAFVGIVMVWISSVGVRGAVRPVAVTAVTAALLVAPWIARNYRVHGELVFVKSTFGYAFWQGNCALSEGTDKVVCATVEAKLASGDGSLRGWNRALWDARHEAGYLDDIALTSEDNRTLAAVSEPERSRILLRRALADLRSDPLRYPRLCGVRLRYFLLFDETNPKTRSLVYRVSHAGLTVLAVAGWFVMSRESRRRLRPCLVVLGLVTMFHVLTITSARFHIPIEPLMAVAAGLGLDRVRAVLPSLGRPGRSPEDVSPLLVAARSIWAKPAG